MAPICAKTRSEVTPVHRLREYLIKMRLDIGKIHFKPLKWFGLWTIFILDALLVATIVPLSLLLHILYFEKAIERWRVRIEITRPRESNFLFQTPPIVFVAQTLDRAGVVVLAILATVPSFRPFVGFLGVIGLIFMITIFVFLGSFSALIRDLIDKNEQEQKPIEVGNSFVSPLYVEIMNSKPLSVEVVTNKPYNF